MRRMLSLLWLACGACHALDSPTSACLHALTGDARFASIATKLALAQASDATPAMRLDPDLPTLSEQRAVAAWMQARQACFDAGAAFRRDHVPQPLNAIEAAGEDRLAAAAADLQRGRLTYGAFNLQRAAIADEAASHFVAVVRELRHRRQMSGQGQRQTEWLMREQAGRQGRERAQDLALATRQREAGRALDQLQRARQSAADAQAREAASRRQALTQGMLNSMYPPHQQPHPAAIPFALPANCYPTGVAWTCIDR